MGRERDHDLRGRISGDIHFSRKGLNGRLPYPTRFRGVLRGSLLEILALRSLRTDNDNDHDHDHDSPPRRMGLRDRLLGVLVWEI